MNSAMQSLLIMGKLSQVSSLLADTLQNNDVWLRETIQAFLESRAEFERIGVSDKERRQSRYVYGLVNIDGDGINWWLCYNLNTDQWEIDNFDYPRYGYVLGRP